MPASDIVWINGQALATLLEDVPASVEFDKVGVGSASLSYSCLWEHAVDLVAEIDEHPDFPWLVRKSAKITREEANLARVSVSFEGIPPSKTGSEDGNPEYSLDGSTQSEPIATHHNFRLFAGKPTAPLNGAVFENIKDGTIVDASSPASTDEGYRFKEFELVASDPPPSKPKAGITSFEQKGIIYSETTTYPTNDVSEVMTNMNKLGEIDDPPDSPILPDVATGRTWLLASCTVKTVGKGMSVVRQWKLSGRKGWDTDIYSDPP